MAKKLKPDQARTVDALRKVLRFTGRDTLRDLARKVMQYRRKGGESNASATVLIQEATKSKFLHAPAFNKCISLSKMEEGKRAVWLANFDQYREALGLDDIKQGALKFEDEPKKPKAERGVEVRPPGPQEDPPRAETLVDKRKEPTADEIKAIADRAEASSQATH